MISAESHDEYRRGCGLAATHDRSLRCAGSRECSDLRRGDYRGEGGNRKSAEVAEREGSICQLVRAETLSVRASLQTFYRLRQLAHVEASDVDRGRRHETILERDCKSEVDRRNLDEPFARPNAVEAGM